MILDQIGNAELYRGVGKGISTALDYLKRTDFSKLGDGKYELDGTNLFAIVQRYKTKALEQAGWEAHRKYIDVQYIVEGEERMGVALMGAGMDVAKAYDAATDLIFYQAKGDYITVRAGEFVIFGPKDIHAPSLCVAGDCHQSVVKVVVKCRAD